jgi:hypothetical protein
MTTWREKHNTEAAKNNNEGGENYDALEENFVSRELKHDVEHNREEIRHPRKVCKPSPRRPPRPAQRTGCPAAHARQHHWVRRARGGMVDVQHWGSAPQDGGR